MSDLAARVETKLWLHGKDSETGVLLRDLLAALAAASRERDEARLALQARLNEAPLVYEAQRDAASAREREARLREALRRLEWSFRQTALRNAGTIYTAELCPACMGERNPPDDKGPRRRRGDPLPPAGHKPDCWLARALASAPASGSDTGAGEGGDRG